MTSTQTESTGTYRPAARLKEGWQITHNGIWTEITSLVQVTSPVAFAMVTLADGFEVSIPHTHEVMTRTPAEAKRAAVDSEVHVVADDSSNPEHVDDCPGCPTA